MEKRLDKSTFGQVLSREDMEGDVYKRAHESFQRLREVSGVQDREDLRYGELFIFLPKEWNPGETGQHNSGIPEEEYRPVRLITSLRRRRPP